jgi:hypothetical protein
MKPARKMPLARLNMGPTALKIGRAAVPHISFQVAKINATNAVAIDAANHGRGMRRNPNIPSGNNQMKTYQNP